jgi:DNA-binding Lrp family transcriptional regulator
MLNKREKDILLYISRRGLNISQRPFMDVASALGMTEEGVIDTFRRLRDNGVIKALRGVFDHKKAGYRENALLAWWVPPDKIHLVKEVFIKHDLISHCYEREPRKEFNYNIFTMMHADDIGMIEDFARDVSAEFGIDCVTLFTDEELKKEKLDLEELLCNMS